MVSAYSTGQSIDPMTEQLGFLKALGPGSIEEKIDEISLLPEALRAKISEFCYRRVHLRELGLRIAATCRIETLRVPFGTSAAAVLKQAAEVESIAAALESTDTRASSYLLI